MMFLDCPAYLDEDGTARCGLPAEVMALAEDPQWCSANFPTWLMVRLSG